MSDPVTELVKAHLKQLRLPAMARELERLSREAAASDRNYEQFLLRLAEAELAARSANALEGRIKNAAFPVAKDFDTYAFSVMPALSKPKLLELALCEWIDQKFNCCFVGTTGTGKTHLATGLGLAACRRGLRVRFFTAASLVSKLEQAQKQYTLDKFLGQLDRAESADLRRAGVRVVQPQRGGAAVPTPDGPVRAVERADHEQPGVRRLGAGVPGGADDRGTPRQDHPQVPHLRDERGELPIPGVDEGQERPEDGVSLAWPRVQEAR